MKTVTEYEASIAARAAYWTACRGYAKSRVRIEFPTEAEAVHWAETNHASDGRTMIYAVTPEGRFAHIRNV